MRRVAAFIALLLVVGVTNQARGVSTDPLKGQQWGLDKIKAQQAWTRATGVGITVAVVDTGVDTEHPELAGKLVKGASWLDCGKRVDKPCTVTPQTPKRRGNKPAPSPRAPWDDRHGHGTHVAGIIAAPLDNVGVVGA